MAIDVERRERLVEAIKSSALDAILCSSPSEVLLLTGYWPVMGASIAILHATGEVKVVLPEDEVEIAEKTSDALRIPYKPAGLHTLESPLAQLAEKLRSATKDLTHARIGMLMKEGMQPASYAVMSQFRSSLLELLREMLPGATFEGCDDLVETQKAAKTPKELGVMDTACRVAAVGFAKAEEAIATGLREAEVAAIVQQAFEATTEATSLQRSYGFFYCMSGPNAARAAAAYARTRQRVIQRDDLVMVHANTCADGYWTDLTRTFTAGGPPTERQKEMRAAIMEAREAGLKAICPKVLGRDVDTAVRSVMERLGLGSAFKHASGHGVGFAAANPQGRPRIHPLSDDVLDVGMTFNLEPAAYFDGYGGMRHCDLVAVTADGARVMTEF
jgi:Xaa-Pro aminopeptidase